MDELRKVEVVPVIDKKPVSECALVGDLLSIISFKDPADETSDGERVVKRNSFRDVHRPDISKLDWVSQVACDDEVHCFASLLGHPER